MNSARFVSPSLVSPSVRSHLQPHMPHRNPCAQCGQPIADPSWSEGDERRVCYVWSCDDCGYEFTTLVMYPPSEERRIAA